METLPLLGIALGLAMDAFSVAVGVGFGLAGIRARQALRLSFHFGLFQFLMPMLGWLAGTTVASYISEFDHWIAFVLLGYVGGKMIHESFSDGDDKYKEDPTRGTSLVLLSVATSIDALAVGLTMAMLKLSVFGPAVVIGIVAAVMTLAGVIIGRYAGRTAGKKLGPWMERFGGVVLLAIGLRILVEHLFG